MAEKIRKKLEDEKSGEMKTEWLKHNNGWFYFNYNCDMLTGKQAVNVKFYEFDSRGYWIK
nr:hypothetical protein [uncultured Peptostreptococcus sp.]